MLDGFDNRVLEPTAHYARKEMKVGEFKENKD